MRTLILTLVLLGAAFIPGPILGQDLTPEELAIVKKAEQKRIAAIEKAVPSVVAIYGDDRQGGGSGVVIDPSGLALTNHHVIMAAGVEGWGGLSDGKLYRWKLIGTDPGGDVSLIQMLKEADDDPAFPYTNLGDSDKVRVGDWALAMGNPFVLTEDQKPTVTLGIVSGVKRYQHGAGQNQLVYGNCIQVDSSINPGNSGGPLFNMNAEVIGINGRGSFQDRGRVNVGLGYAISSNQIKNFLPDLLATKLVEHGTLDASFSDRGGKVVCSVINEDSPIAKAGLELEDELLMFEGIPISNANQYTNLICTLPEDWPAKLEIRKKDGKELTLNIRMYGLPYATPSSRPPDAEEDDPDAQRQIEMQQQMFDLLAAQPGTIREEKINRNYANQLIAQSQFHIDAKRKPIEIVDEIFRGENKVGSCRTLIDTDGRFSIEWTEGDSTIRYAHDGEKFGYTKQDFQKDMTLTESKLTLPVIQAMACALSSSESPFQIYGKIQLDGSDKALARNAYRFKLLDDDEDWFYFWMTMYNDTNGYPAVELIKAGADKDLRHNDGGVAFANWQTESGWRLPFEKTFIEGLDERVDMVMRTTSVKEVEELDESLFEVASAEEQDSKPAVAELKADQQEDANEAAEVENQNETEQPESSDESNGKDSE